MKLQLPNPDLEDRILTYQELDRLEVEEAGDRQKWDNKAQYMLTCFVSECKKSSPVDYFWYRETLNTTPMIEEDGGLQWWILLCHICAWSVLYICIIRGIETTGKAVYVTSTLPYVVLTIFLIRGLTLKGSLDGIKFLFTPDGVEGTGLAFIVFTEAITKMPISPLWAVLFFIMLFCLGLSSMFGNIEGVLVPLQDLKVFPKTWPKEAVTGAFLIPYGIAFVFEGLPLLHMELAIGQRLRMGSVGVWNSISPYLGGLGYVSECEKSSPVNYFWYRETLNITPNIETSGPLQWWLVLCLASAWCLVYICFIRGIETIGKSVSGTGLAFIVFTEAVIKMPGAQVWAVLFFVMLFSLGLSSMFGNLEGVLTPLLDLNIIPSWIPKEIFTGLICFGSFTVALLFTLGSGNYWLEIFNSYVGSMPLLIIAFFEIISVVYIYGINRFNDDIEWMTGRRPNIFWQATWRFISPLMLLVVFVAYVVVEAEKRPTYNTWNPEYEMSQRADASQCGGVVVESESDDITANRNRSVPGAALIYLKGPKFLIYVSGALSMWGDRMWHFAISVFLIELYGRNLLLTAVFGLVVAGSVLLLGALIGDWVDRNPRNKDVANLASTALTIAIQRDWIVVITGYNRGHLAGMNATMRRIDQVTNILAPLVVGQVMTLASNVVGCGFILGWNVVSLIVEFFFLSRVYRIVPALSAKPPVVEVDQVYLQRLERRKSQGGDNAAQPQPLTEGNCNTSRHIKEIPNLPLCFRRLRWLVSTCKDGWRAYYRQPVFWAGMGLAFLYTTVLGFDCITTGYAYTQGISGSLLSLLMGVSALTGLMGTVMFTRLRKSYGLVNTGIISSCLHLGCLLLCVCSVFAPGSPMDLSLLRPYITSNSSSELGGVVSQRQKHIYSLRGSSYQPLLPDRSSIHWTNNTMLFDNVPSDTAPESYISIILLFLGVITARVGLWSFDLTVTQILQENICESERGVVNGVQSSMNYLMDLLHFIMVISAPQPQHFGILVIISVLFITTGHTMYFLYAHKVKRKRLHDT
ncbi:Solute carrier family 40 member 1 [Liparis tanakae]|uniref:Solute carrier family 40 member 1 n=1 Tax=Liparis tanakae TaxID=230148 RepID=A0A4Z2ILP7_9TELE|nr:Solute carrier family 40 member 1 [Liparis tanakae]